MSRTPAWVRRAGRPGTPPQSRGWVEPALAAAALVVSCAALIFSVVAFRETERTSDPIVALAADARAGVDLMRDGSLVGQVVYGEAVFTNRGRTPVDVLEVVAVGLDDEPIEANVYFGDSCAGGQHATLNPGSSLPVVSVQADPDLVPQYYRVLLATGIEAVPVERRKAGTPEWQAILGAYDHEIRALLNSCQPDLVSALVD